ncbi:MAG: GNAT family N-acetyltransferase [Clostridiales bacterium]|nr:GNAT family N-acetyltransferase [Clostridiales bacterium]
MQELKHLGAVTINTKSFILRPFKKTDYLNMYKNWASDSDVAKYLSWVAHENIETTKHLCEIWEKESLNLNNYNWAIEYKKTKEAVGSIAVVKMCENINEAEIGYCLSKKLWGKGFMTECFSAVIDFLIVNVGFNRISATHNTPNIGSGKVMLKCGMRFEGISRSSTLTNLNQICDLAHYSILKDEYNK